MKLLCFIFGVSLLSSSLLTAAEINMDISASILQPAVISSNFKPDSNTLNITSTGDNNFSLRLESLVRGRGDSLKVRINDMVIDHNAATSQIIPIDSELSVTVVRNDLASEQSGPVVTISYN